jgi:hypothetical protein
MKIPSTSISTSIIANVSHQFSNNFGSIELFVKMPLNYPAHVNGAPLADSVYTPIPDFKTNQLNYVRDV